MTNTTTTMTTTTNTTKTNVAFNAKEIAKATKFFDKYGVKFLRKGEAPQRGVTVYIKDCDKVSFKSPFVYEMSVEHLVNYYKICKSCGPLMISILTGLKNSIQYMNDETYVSIVHREGEESGDRILKTMYEYFNKFLNLYGISIPKNKLTFAWCNNFALSFGGSKGVERLFNRVFKDIADALENNTEPEPVFSACFVCRNCSIEDGEGFCKRMLISVPKEMSISEAADTYSNVCIKNGVIMTSHLISDIPEDTCEVFIDRRPFRR